MDRLATVRAVFTRQVKPAESPESLHRETTKTPASLELWETFRAENGKNKARTVHTEKR
jgi:hypothetical protein